MAGVVQHGLDTFTACGWCSMVWTCSLHVGDIRREMLKMLLVYTRGEDETWISQKTE